MNEIKKYLSIIQPEKPRGELIYSKAGSLYYTSCETTVGELTEQLFHEKYAFIVCIVDKNMKALGIIIKDKLLNLMGQKFGRELYQNRQVNSVMEEVPHLYYKRNTFSVIEELRENLQDYKDTYYILVDSEDRFKGTLSSRDLTIFLSDMMTMDIIAARKVHKAIVKEETVLINESFEFTGASIMAGGIGGDFHAIRQINEDSRAIIFFDVSGKGMKAALISVAISSMFSVYEFGNDFKDFIKKINTYIFDLFNGENFITGVFIIFNSTTGELKVYDMGHSLLYLLKDDRVFQLKSSQDNIPLGVKEEINPEYKTVNLENGNIMISVSDGVIEQHDYKGAPYGEKQLISSVVRYRSLDTKSIKNAILKDIAKYRHGQAQGDDMSIMLLRYNG